MKLDAITELSILYEIASISSKTLDLEQIMEIAVDKSVRLLGNDAAVFYLISTGKDYFVPRGARGVPVTFVLPIQIETIGEPTDFLLLPGGSENVALERILKEPYRIRHAALFPIHYQNKVIGLLLVIRFRGEPFDQTVLQLLGVLKKHIELRLENFYILQEKEEAFNKLLYERRKLEELNKTLQQKNLEIEKVNREAQAARQAAEFANEAKSEFLANMSHELRTPLNAILGYAQVLRRNKELNAESAVEGLETIQRSGDYLLSLINDILDLSKIEARKMELYPTILNLPQFLAEIIEIIQMKVQQKALRFVYEADDNLPSAIEADERCLRQVLLNLLGNAVKFTDEGEVTFRVKILDTGYSILDTSDQHPASSIQFEVEDTGIGITPEQLDKIFLPFEQVGDIRQRTIGTGLGLAISHKLVQLMGGALQVKSEFGKGSTFWFEAAFPIMAMEYEIPSHRKCNITGYKGRQRTVLIVDDKPDNRLMLRDLLRPIGFECVEAESGPEGIEKARDLRPDVIIMDLIMPDMNGFEAIGAIRTMPELADVVIIAVSASAFEHERANSKKAGSNAFLAKPVDMEQLFVLLEKYLKLEWTYEVSQEETASILEDVEKDREIILPPSEEMERLHQLALMGNMAGIRERAAALEQVDSKFQPFASKLSQLAKQYQDELLLDFIEHFMKKNI